MGHLKQLCSLWQEYLLNTHTPTVKDTEPHAHLINKNLDFVIKELKMLRKKCLSKNVPISTFSTDSGYCKYNYNVFACGCILNFNIAVIRTITSEVRPKCVTKGNTKADKRYKKHKHGCFNYSSYQKQG